jgi:elongation factor P
MKFLSFAVTLLLATGVSAFAPTTPAFTRTSSALGVAIDTSDIKNGMTIELDGDPYKVLSFSIMKQARGAAKTTIKFKNLVKGNTIENTYRSGEKFQTALIEKAAHQFTYEDGVSSFCLGEAERNKKEEHSSVFNHISTVRLISFLLVFCLKLG